MFHVKHSQAVDKDLTSLDSFLKIRSRYLGKLRRYYF